MSNVYLAMDKRLNKQWAVKAVIKNARDKNNILVAQRAIAEANMMKKLDHPYLPRIVDIIEESQLIYVIMDYVEGESLDKVLYEYGAQQQESVIEWGQQLCKVLEYLHTCDPPIIYRDMKPSNIVLQPNGSIKLLDFGIAREYKEHNIADTVNLGTKGYAAPEQFGNNGQTDARTDIYCLGVTLYHLLTGKSPCEEPYELYPIRSWNSNLSSGLEHIIQKCTHANPENRYQSCTELLYALNHYKEMDHSYRKKQKSKLYIFIMVFIAALLFLSMGITGIVMQKRINNNNYIRNLQLAEKAVTDTEKIELYSKAIDIKPNQVAAYIGLINAFKYDASFTIDEEEIFKKKISINITVLRKLEDYPNLAFEIGKLYWYYFAYAKSEGVDNQITRIKSAIQWFDDAVEFGSLEDDYYKMAIVYRDIGKFNRDIILNIEEASDKGEYAQYYNNIRRLLVFVGDNPDENEIVCLELYKLVIYSVETYARKFKADGICLQNVQYIFEISKHGINKISTTTNKTEEIKSNVEERLGMAQEAINNAYKNS